MEDPGGTGLAGKDWTWRADPNLEHQVTQGVKTDPKLGAGRQAGHQTELAPAGPTLRVIWADHQRQMAEGMWVENLGVSLGACLLAWGTWSVQG